MIYAWRRLKDGLKLRGLFTVRVKEVFVCMKTFFFFEVPFSDRFMKIGLQSLKLRGLFTVREKKFLCA